MINEHYKMKKIFFSINNKYKMVGAISGFILCFFGYGQTSKIITVKANEIKASIQPTMWGVFFEDINLGADGGIYAELVKNRSFEFYKPMMGWKILGKPATEALL